MAHAAGVTWPVPPTEPACKPAKWHAPRVPLGRPPKPARDPRPSAYRPAIKRQQRGALRKLDRRAEHVARDAADALHGEAADRQGHEGGCRDGEQAAQARARESDDHRGAHRDGEALDAPAGVDERGAGAVLARVGKRGTQPRRCKSPDGRDRHQPEVVSAHEDARRRGRS